MAEHKLEIGDENFSQQLQRAQWLRAAILGANDGLLSTTSLMLGVGAAKDDRWSMILSGLAGALAGACSMAVGEFVSVSTQRDIERVTFGDRSSKAGLYAQDEHGIKPDGTTHDTKLGGNNLAMSTLAKFPPVVSPGRSPVMKVIAENVKTSAMKVLEDIGEEALPNPYKAAAASALAFLCGSFVPLVSAVFVAKNIMRIAVIVVVASVALAVFGGIGAYVGNSSVRVSALRVLIGGWMAMGITYGLLKPFDRNDDNTN